MYLEALNEIIQVLATTVGPGRALHVLGLAHPFAPPDGVTDYDSEVRLIAHVESQKGRPDKELKGITLSSLKNAEDFLVEHRKERLRQAKTSFNTALAFISIAGIAVIAGVVLVFTDHIAKGAVSSVAGVVSGVASRPFFRMSRDANDRLDKLTAGIAKLESLRKTLTPAQREDNSTKRKNN